MTAFARIVLILLLALPASAMARNTELVGVWETRSTEDGATVGAFMSLDTDGAYKLELFAGDASSTPLPPTIALLDSMAFTGTRYSASPFIDLIEVLQYFITRELACQENSLLSPPKIDCLRR